MVCLGHVDVVDFLTDKGANVNAIDEDNWTPLICSTLPGNTLFHFCDRMTIILTLVAPGHLNVVKLLIEKGANVDAKTKFNWTSLIYATRLGN